MRGAIRYASLLFAPLWAYIAIVYALDAFNPDANILDTHVDPGFTGMFVLALFIFLLTVPLAALTALLAFVEMLVARRWAWRALLPTLPVGFVLLALWVNTSSTSLAFQMRQSYGWSPSYWYFVYECCVAIAFTAAVIVEVIIFFRFAPERRRSGAN
jgi:hypothetical protein